MGTAAIREDSSQQCGAPIGQAGDGGGESGAHDSEHQAGQAEDEGTQDERVDHQAPRGAQGMESVEVLSQQGSRSQPCGEAASQG